MTPKEFSIVTSSTPLRIPTFLGTFLTVRESNCFRVCLFENGFNFLILPLFIVTLQSYTYEIPDTVTVGANQYLFVNQEAFLTVPGISVGSGGYADFSYSILKLKSTVSLQNTLTPSYTLQFSHLLVGFDYAGPSSVVNFENTDLEIKGSISGSACTNSSMGIDSMPLTIIDSNTSFRVSENYELCGILRVDACTTFMHSFMHSFMPRSLRPFIQRITLHIIL